MVAVLIFSALLYLFYAFLRPKSRKAVPKAPEPARIALAQPVDDHKDLVLPIRLVPWTGKRPTQFEAYQQLDENQKQFFDYFFDSLLESEYWDITPFENYAFLAARKAAANKALWKDIHALKWFLSKLVKNYPATKTEVSKVLFPMVQSVDELNSVINGNVQRPKNAAILPQTANPTRPDVVSKTIDNVPESGGPSLIQEEPEPEADEPINKTTTAEEATMGFVQAVLNEEDKTEQAESTIKDDVEAADQKQDAGEDSIIDVSQTDTDFLTYKQNFQQWLEKPAVGGKPDEEHSITKEIKGGAYNFSEYNDSDVRLGNQYRLELGLSNEQVSILNGIAYFSNNFNEIKECRREVVRLFVGICKEMDDSLKLLPSSLQNEMNLVAGIAANKIYRYRLGSSNYQDATRQFVTDFYYLIFKIAENAVRDRYAHKRKLNVEVQYDQPIVKAEVENRILAVARDAVNKLKDAIPQPKIETEVLLNEQNTARWKIEFETLQKELPHNPNAFYSGICELGKRNMLNPSVELIFFEGSKGLAKIDRKLSVQLFVQYYYHDLHSETFDNRQLSKSFQKALFVDPKLYLQFEEIIKELAISKNLDAALESSVALFSKRRRLIKIDHNAVEQVKHRHHTTVVQLNEVLREEDDEGERDEAMLAEPLVGVSVSTTAQPQVMAQTNGLLTDATHIELMHLFVKSNFTVLQTDVQEFAQAKGLFHNQLVNQLNELCYETIDDVLIEEEDDQYIINPDYYYKIISNG